MKADGDPNLICYFGGEFMRLGDAKVGILTHALHYGTGVFEGIRAHWDPTTEELYLLRSPEHFDRWKKNCGILRIEMPLDSAQLTEITIELLRRNNIRTNAYIRPLAYKSAERVGVSFDDQDNYFIVALPFGDYLPSEHGLHAGVSSWRRVEDNAIPARAKICGAYVNSALASDEVRRSGYDEAIFLNESGHVAEGSTCNIFMVRDGVLITPPVSENVLEGITRDCVKRLAHNELCMEVVERSIDRSELYVCDELFFTGTAVGLAPIVRVDHHPVGDGKLGRAATRIQQLYFDATRGHMPTYSNWLAPVYRSRSLSAEDLRKLVEA